MCIVFICKGRQEERRKKEREKERKRKEERKKKKRRKKERKEKKKKRKENKERNLTRYMHIHTSLDTEEASTHDDGVVAHKKKAISPKRT